MNSGRGSTLRCTHGCDGFTLVEVMVGMLVGLLLIGGVIQTHAAASASRRVQESLAAQAERARFAIARMGRDLRMAGHGGVTPAIEFTADRIVVRHDDVVVSYFVSGGSLRYRRVVDGTVVFNNQPLVEGFSSQSVWFGVGDRDSGAVSFLPADDVDTAALDDVWGVRVSLSMQDGQTVEASFALRNPLLASTAPVYPP